MRYKNLTRNSKTFYGIEFKPGEVKDVPGYINHPKFIRVSESIKSDKVESFKQDDSNKIESPKQDNAKKVESSKSSKILSRSITKVNSDDSSDPSKLPETDNKPAENNVIKIVQGDDSNGSDSNK